MKTIITLSIVFLTITSSFAINTNVSKVDTATNTSIIIFNQNLNLPWANNSAVVMDKVISKDEYTLWRCESNNVKNYPGQNITGKSYNYFVYKNNKFHLTVNEMNKANVYTFFLDYSKYNKQV
jgi:hypothetical protein